MKQQKIYAEHLEEKALEQFDNAMEQDFVIKGALMADAHVGYALPIGAVVATKDVIVPAWVGYDIGCGMCAYNTQIPKSEIEPHKEKIFKAIYRSIPVGFFHHKKRQEWDYSGKPMSDFLQAIFKKSERKALAALGTLGGGNHFIEISYDENDHIWVIIHSGSRNVGHFVGTHYMTKAHENFIKNAHPDIIQKYEDTFDKEKYRFKENNPEEFYKSRARFVNKSIAEKYKNVESHYSFDIESPIGKDYICDMNFCLDFALENRKRMMNKVLEEIFYYVYGKKDIDYDISQESERFINRNHNHAEKKDDCWIHRKGATHAEKGMRGVIPGNMRDGSFIVKGKGNSESLCSSSHGAGRIMSRFQANKNIDMKDFTTSMNGITAKVDEYTKDESPFAYKNIFEVMDLQKDLLEVVHHLKPLINIKG